MYTKRLICSTNIPKAILDELQRNYIKAGAWDSKDEVVEKFKSLMKDELYSLQDGKCAYCELPLETRNPEIEHIAPKGGEKRPKHIECMFLPMNLVYSCHNCNSPQCKGQKDTVISKDSDDYSEWTFSIVHPYLDNPQDFFDIPPLADGSPGVFPVPKRDADDYHKRKARKTIEMFKLNGEKCLELAKEYIARKHGDEINEIVKSISMYRMK